MPESAEKCRISLRINPVNQLSLRRRGLDGNFQERQLDHQMRRRKRTGGIGGARVSGEQESLAAAAAKIFGTAITTAAGLGHPRLSAEFLEHAGLVPNPFERMLANIVEGEFGNHTGGVQGSALPVGSISINWRPQPPMQGLG